jgi:hypothetical protein
MMDFTTFLIIAPLLVVLFGFAWYSRKRWWR